MIVPRNCPNMCCVKSLEHTAPLIASVVFGTQSVHILRAGDVSGELSPKLAWLLVAALAAGGFAITSALHPLPTPPSPAPSPDPSALIHQTRQITGPFGAAAHTAIRQFHRIDILNAFQHVAGQRCVVR